MKFSKTFFNLTVSIILSLAIHISKAYHVQVFSTLISSRECEGWALDPPTGKVYFYTGYLNCTGTCKILDYNSPPPDGSYGIQIHEYKWSKDGPVDSDICYEASGSEATWYLNVVDCSKFSGVGSCPSN
ncbi:hypothetical protein RclHR1_00150001 [Rhizophagus clarus]|uniref:Secreted protein n=1 Tax=Rhizophagus clarus TaxID=94130 RepID=A0A2Z6QFU2_9GLOM|nr:hypothetical protein RclHR1_00150001 [Rhizophagus clarus]